MGETAYLNGSSTVVAPYGAAALHGIVKPSSAAASNGSVAPYSNGAPPHHSNSVVTAANGMAPFSNNSVAPAPAAANGMAPYSNGAPALHGFVNPSSATANGMSPYSNGAATTLHAIANSNGPSAAAANGVASYSNGAAAVPNGVANSIPPASNGVAPPYTNGASALNGVATNGVAAPPNSTTMLNLAINGSNGASPAAKASNGNLSAISNGALADAELPTTRRPCFWYEEEIDESLRWCFGLTSILHTGVSKYQEIALLETQPFGKVLILDRKLQSAEMDEWVYHECLVHPALLFHSSPKNVFIMGGGEGSTAREALRHRSVRKVVMCDIDREVVDFCETYLTVNKDAFKSNRLELVINDARAELENREERFDIIIGDLADPMEGGPCYQLYSKGFYENVVKPRLTPGGIFVTQAGPAGILSHKEVFSSIYNTLRHVFAHVVAYSAHVPSYADTWGWVMASDQPFSQSAEDLDARIKQRVKGELRYLDGATLTASTVLNKTIRQTLANEKHVYTEDSARFVYGHGRGTAGAH